jgi:hypothetical protein
MALDQLHWVKAMPGANGVWHLSFDSLITLCGRKDHCARSLGLRDGPPLGGSLCGPCKQIIGIWLGLL